jgi:hypothetical protein
MAKEIKAGRVLINLQTGQQITAKAGKHTQRLIVKRGNIMPPRIWAWDYEDVPVSTPQMAAAAVSIANAKLSEKEEEIARLKAMLAAQQTAPQAPHVAEVKARLGRKPKQEQAPFETLQDEEVEND